VALDAAAKVIATNATGLVALATPSTFLRGSRVSLAGTLDSPENAVEITLLMTVIPESNGDWSLQLKLSAAPGLGGK
jgi:hypothetical protein